jgi:two-component system, LytTR family, sensor kinase
MDGKRWRTVGLVLVPWTLFAIYSGAETHFRSSFGKNPYSWSKAMIAEGSYCFLWAALTPLVSWFARRRRIEKPRLWTNLGIHFVTCVVLSVLTKTLWDLIFQRSTPWSISPFSWSKYLLSMSMGFMEGMLLYSLILMSSYTLDYYRKYQAGLTRAADLHTQLVQSQLQALKMQLHPHFLFNTLHSISALIHEDPEAADRMIARLSELLRLSLDSGSVQQVPLYQELRFLDLYLAIEKTRFEDRLEVSFEIQPDANEALVPNMILQPLVENSIRHGLSPMVRKGRIRISAERDQDKLVMKVTDNGMGFAPMGVTTTQEGIGLGATRGRLERLYGNEQGLLLRNLSEGGVEALIMIPFTTSTFPSLVGEAYACDSNFDRG